MSQNEGRKRVSVVGAGPAGLMAAQTCCAHGMDVVVFDAMPSAGRKFLLAGRGGLNLTHSEGAAAFLSRFDDRVDHVAPWLARLDGDGVRQWAQALGVSTFVGSSGRVFPAEMKAAPLLRAWLARLRASGVTFHMRHRLQALNDARTLTFDTPAGEQTYHSDAVVLACGGASWPRLGSDGSWATWLADRGVEVAPLRAANCGFDVAWSDHLAARHAGEPVKNLKGWATSVPKDTSTGASPFKDRPDVFEALTRLAPDQSVSGEIMLGAGSIEGGLVYACAKALRSAQETGRTAVLVLDLLPQHDIARVIAATSRARGAKSWSSHLGSVLGLRGARLALLRECAPEQAWARPEHLAAVIKRLPIALERPRPIEEAISSAGGVRFDALDAQLQCRALPGVFCAGEMLDWEAPTGGYLLTACLASGVVAAEGVLASVLGAP